MVRKMAALAVLLLVLPVTSAWAGPGGARGDEHVYIQVDGLG